MIYILSLYLILAIDFIVIALQVKYARRNKKREALATDFNPPRADVEGAKPKGRFSTSDSWPVVDGKRVE